MTEGTPMDALLNWSMFIYGPFESYLDGNRVLFKTIDIEEVPYDYQLLWGNSTAHNHVLLIQETHQALIDAHKGGGYCRYTHKDSVGLTPSLALSPSINVGFFKIKTDEYGIQRYKRVPENHVPVEVKQKWEDAGTPDPGTEKVSEWIVALEQSATGETSYCRWCPLHNDEDDVSWINIMD